MYVFSLEETKKNKSKNIIHLLNAMHFKTYISKHVEIKFST